MEIRSTARVNLVQHELGTTITSPHISSDGYDITNLLTNSSNGFLVEHFIKPPIFIHIEFICNIFVHEIIINTRVGTQKSKGIEILVDDTTVGKCFLNSQQDVVQWVRNSNTDKIKDCTRNDAFSKCNFYTGAHRHLNSTKRITIKVFKTENSSLVSMKNLKIFGSINKKTNTGQDIQKYVDLLHNIHTRTVANQNLFGERNMLIEKYENSNGEKYSKDNGCVAENVSIPEDFLDPITHEFMTNPIILPCGKIIDKSTLDKYLDIELKWNRLPNDPFTHVKFNQNQKPVQALQLKSRIDKFLILNSENSFIDKFPRTIQNSKTVHENLLFKMFENQDVYSRNPYNSFVEKSKRGYLPEGNIDSPVIKRRKTCSHAQIKINNSTISVKSYFENQTMKKDGPKDEPNKPLNAVNSLDSELKFQDVIDLTKDVGNFHKPSEYLKQEDDLEKQIQSTLKNLPSFIDSSKVDSNLNDVVTMKSCCKCNQDHLLYKIIKCAHYICRPCLVTNKNDTCMICNIDFSSNDVIRIFNS